MTEPPLSPTNDSSNKKMKMTSETKTKTTKLRALGFCGIDDSVNPKLLGILSHVYPIVEFGVLFRPDKEGSPR